MYNDSEHVRNSLSKLHPRIKVLRHPQFSVWLWSHHEKMVIIDRMLVFLGGLDLTWGRWDTGDHHLLSAPPGEEEL